MLKKQMYIIVHKDKLGIERMKKIIRLAVWADLDGIEDGYREHFLYEEEHVRYTVFKEDVYPTINDAEKALRNGALYVYEEKELWRGANSLMNIRRSIGHDQQQTRRCGYSFAYATL